MPEFMDVTEIDALVTSGATLTGGESAIGVLHSGSASGTLQYTESPTIRYTPLYGQTLVAQIASPISVQSISDIINSEWPIAAVLDFALERLAPGKAHYRALNLIGASGRSPAKKLSMVKRRARAHGRCRGYLAEHNYSSKPFVWTADPERIISAARRGYQMLDSNH